MRRRGQARSGIGASTPEEARRRRPQRGKALFTAFLLLVAVGVLLAVPSALSEVGPPTISTDQADYAPGATVTLTGANWQPGESIHIAANDSAGETWSYSADTTADEAGGFTHQFQLPTSFVSTYLVTATGPLSGTATTTFSDSAANLDQCTNGGVGMTPERCVDNSTLSNWVNGNSNGSKSHWAEDEFLPYRASVTGITAGGHTLSIVYDTVHGGGHALDYLGSFDATETTSPTATVLHANNNDPCSDILPACNPAAPTGSGIIPNPTLVNCGGSLGTAPNLITGSDSARRIKIWGPSGSGITAISYLHENVPSGQGQCSTTVKISFSVGGNASSNTVVLAWAGHIARGSGFNGWGDGDGASGVSGSPYHMAFDTDSGDPDRGLDGATQGGQDRALQAKPPGGAIIPSSTITIVKNTLGGNDTFGYTTGGGGGLPPTFNITTSGGTGQAANNGINPGSYTINETTIPDGWTFVPPISCSTAGGATAAPNSSTQTQADITIPIAGGASVTCTYTNTHDAQVKVVKSLDPSGDGGKFNLQLNGVTKATDVGDGGTTGFVGVPAGSNPTVGEIQGTNTALTDYVSSISCTGDSTASGSGTSLSVGTLSAGQSATCTITNHRKPQLRLKKLFDPSTDGGKVDFTQNGVGDNNATAGYGNGQMTAYKNAPLDNNTASEAGHSGTDLSNYVSDWSCDDANSTHGTGTAIVATDNLDLGYGDQVTCTFTNHRKPQLKVVKTFVGDSTGRVDLKIDSTSFDNGGAGFGTTSVGTDFQNVSTGQHTVSEVAHSAATDLANYDKAISCDGSKGSNSGQASLTTNALAYGDRITCTISNSRLPQLKVVKTFVGDSTGRVDLKIDSTSFDNGGAGFGTTSVGTDFQNVSTGQHTVSEVAHSAATDLANYVSKVECDSNKGSTNPGTSRTLSLAYGDKVTCTITNTRKGKAEVVKTVNLAALSGTQSFTFTLREGADTINAGSILETATATAGNGGVIDFTTGLIPGNHYQLCEDVMPGWNTTLGPSLFVPGSMITPTLPNPNVNNMTVCTDFVATAGNTTIFNVDNSPPPGGRALTIGFWKNWASCANSSLNKKPILDQTLAVATTPPITGLVVSAQTAGSGWPTFGPAYYLVLKGDPSTPATTNKAPDCSKTVNLLNKSTKTRAAKMASDPLFNMTAQLIAAELNYFAGAGGNAPTTNNILSAVLLDGKYKFDGDTYTPKLTSADTTKANCLATQLDNYNNDRSVSTCP
jgi:hypothetical protein